MKYVLADNIELDPNDKFYSERSRGDLIECAQAIEYLEGAARAAFCSVIYGFGLMKPPFFIDWTARYKTWRHKLSPHEVFLNLFLKNEAVLDYFERELLHHLINGEDTFSEHSVGGFSQNELNFISKMLTAARSWDEDDDEPFAVNVPTLH